MSVLIILILASLIIAASFLGGFIWAVRSGQFEDTCTPSMRVLGEETTCQQALPKTFNQPHQDRKIE
jgi:cbb3-type cytochrome oxidase maturation protein